MSREADARPPSPDELAARWPRELRHVAFLAVDSTDSTQRLARSVVDRYLSEDEELPDCAVVALEQTAGRGRRGRTWVSGAGRGLWASWIHREPEATLSSLPMRSSVALAQAVVKLGVEARIKWPNDLIVGARKLGGLLADVVARDGDGDGLGCAILGFGINLARPLAPIEGIRPVGLDELLPASPPDLAELLVLVALALEGALSDSSGDWIERYRELVVHRRGDALTCLLDGGQVEGRFLGFDDRGFLLLETSEGERCLSSGEVFAW